MGESTDGGLYEIFQEEFGPVGSPSFETARGNFLTSSAGYAVASLLLQPKDRHNGNLLFDKYDNLLEPLFWIISWNNHYIFFFVMNVASEGLFTLTLVSFSKLPLVETCVLRAHISNWATRWHSCLIHQVIWRAKLGISLWGKNFLHTLSYWPNSKERFWDGSILSLVIACVFRVTWLLAGTWRGSLVQWKWWWRVDCLALAEEIQLRNFARGFILRWVSVKLHTSWSMYVPMPTTNGPLLVTTWYSTCSKASRNKRQNVTI